MKTKSKKKERVTVQIEMEFSELGPSSMFTLHTQQATFKTQLNGKNIEGELLMAMNGAAWCIDFRDDASWPKGSIFRSRRVILPLNSILQAAMQYVKAHPKPPAAFSK